MKKEKQQESYKCPVCNNTGWILQENGAYKKCECEIERRNVIALQQAGLNIEDVHKTFKSFETYNESTKDMKDIATSYFLSFDVCRRTRNNSIALLGQSGAGKTHLLLALINNFISKKKLSIRYMSYRDDITFLKQSINDLDLYQNKISNYKKAELLVIDDLFKAGYTDSDIRIMMEIINYRYINYLPTMISSELFIDDLINVDMALGGRIKEMTEKFLFQVVGVENNYRMKNKN